MTDETSRTDDALGAQFAAAHARPPPEKVAWAVAAAAVLLLVGVLLVGATSAGGPLLASGRLVLAATLLCPLVMGVMMWRMRGRG